MMGGWRWLWVGERTEPRVVGGVELAHVAFEVLV